MIRIPAISVFILAIGIYLAGTYEVSAQSTFDSFDYPHEIACGNCHVSHHSNTPALLPPGAKPVPNNLDDTWSNNVCLSCHDGSQAPFVVTHSSIQTDDSYGDWSVECRTCHNPHVQEQYWTYGFDSFLTSGSSTNILPNNPTAGQSTFVNTGATWTPGQYQSDPVTFENPFYILVPDTTALFPDNSYTNLSPLHRIIDNTGTTLTVKGILTTADIGQQYAIIYGKLVKDTVTLDEIITYTGTSTSVTSTTLTETGAGWTTDQYAGMVLIPNSTRPEFTYAILSNTGDTLTVSGTIDLIYVTAGDIFQIVSLKTGDKTIKFFDTTGTNSFADGDTTYDGICEGCHTLTDHFRNDGTGPDQDHMSQGPSIPGSDCIACHAHDNGFQGAGDCVDCHGTSGPGIDVQTEFGTAITDVSSHHISKAWADMAGEDCVACHAEGNPNGDGTASKSALHPDTTADGTVEMIDNSDSTRTTVLSINLTNLEGKDNTGGDADNLVTFCFGCHRSGGATAVTSGNGFDADHTSTNPFGETTNIRTNQYDQVQKQFGSGGSLSVYEAFDTAETGDPDADGARENHHAVRGARYSTSNLGTNGFLDTTLALWDSSTLDDDSVMFCTDCHSVAFSAHGGANEYMLQTAASEQPAAEHTGVSEYVCLKCHIGGGGYNDGAAHSDNAQNFQHTSDQSGSARASGNSGHITGIACLNCHDGNVLFGGIHGFPDATYTAGNDGAGQGTYNKRRFLPGSALAWYDPSDSTSGDAAWEMSTTGSDNTCYTIDAEIANVSACTQHSGMNGTSFGRRNIQRNVDY